MKILKYVYILFKWDGNVNKLFKNVFLFLCWYKYCENNNVMWIFYIFSGFIWK